MIMVCNTSKRDTAIRKKLVKVELRFSFIALGLSSGCITSLHFNNEYLVI